MLGILLGIMHYDGSPTSVFYDGARAAEGRSSGVELPQIGSVASRTFHDPRRWDREAQSRVGEGGA
jgi:hypothetical protein